MSLALPSVSMTLSTQSSSNLSDGISSKATTSLFANVQSQQLRKDLVGLCVVKSTSLTQMGVHSAHSLSLTLLFLDSVGIRHRNPGSMRAAMALSSALSLTHAGAFPNSLQLEGHGLSLRQYYTLEVREGPESADMLMNGTHRGSHADKEPLQIKHRLNGPSIRLRRECRIGIMEQPNAQ